MKRDMDLCRKILLSVEAREGSVGPEEVKIEGLYRRPNRLPCEVARRRWNSAETLTATLARSPFRT